MKPCWLDAGVVNEEGARRADKALPTLIALLENFGTEVIDIALREAKFRVNELPKLTPRYQARYRKENE